MTQAAQRALFVSKSKRQKHNIGMPIKTQLFGREITGTIVAVHPFGTVDIEIKNAHGKSNYYRVSGLALSEG